MSGNRTKQEYNGNGSSSGRPGAERSDGSRGYSSGAAGARGRGSGSRGRGRGGGGSGREAYHHQQQYDQQWMPPTGGSGWRGGRGRGKGNYHRNMSRSYNNDSHSTTSGNGSSGSAVLVPGSSIRGPRDGGGGGGSSSSTSNSTSNSNSHRSNDYAHRSNYYAGRSSAPPPPPPPPPPRPAEAGATSTDGGGGSSSSSRNKRPAPASPSNGDDGDSGGRRRRRNQSKSARADSREEENAARTGAGSGGNGDKAGGEGADVGSGGGGGGGGGGSTKRARSNKGRSRSRQREDEGSGREGEGKGSSGSANSVSDRRQAKLKELKVLDGRRKAAVAAGEVLAKEVEKNRMEQDEIAIQIDAAKRLLALYDSNSDTPDVAILTSPPPAPAPAPAQAPRAEHSSTAAAASRLGSFSGAVRGRGGGSAAARGNRVSGSSPSLSAPAARSNGKASTRRAADSGRKEDSSSSSSSSSDNDDEDYPLGSTRVGLPGGVGGEGFGLITSMPPAGGGSGSGSGGSSSRNGAGRNAVAAASAAAAASRKPPASVDAADEFPARVPSDGAGAGAGEGALDSGGPGPGRTSGSGVGGGSGGGSRETTGVHRGVEVNRDSFNIVKQLMFQTSRSRKPRTMAFNPVDPGLFAVCSADLSVDLWRYGRNKQELEKVSERNDVTPVGGAHMAWNPSGTHLAIGHSGGTLVNNWAATIIAKDGRRKSDMKLRSDRHTKPAQAVAWVTPSKNNQDHLVTGGEDGHVVIWTRVLDAESDLHKVAILHSRHTSAVRSACCPSISPTVVTGGADGRLVSYSIETASVQWEELLRVSKTYHPMVNELLEFPDNPHSLLVSTVDTAKSHSLFTMDTRQPTSLIHTARRMEWKRKDEKKSFSGLVYPSISPCGRYVACAGDWNGCFHIWDVRSARSEPMQSVLVNSVARVVHTAWHPDQDARALMSLSAASGQGGKNFALHLHGGLRS